MASLSMVDIRTATGSNYFGIRKEFKLDTRNIASVEVKKAILGSVMQVPVQDTWRIRCLKNYLEQRYQQEANHQDTSLLDELIDSICTT